VVAIERLPWDLLMLVITTVAVITKATSAGLLDYLMEQKL
jgi:hypothetical protein